MLNYNKLKYFTVAARHCNMTRAADELYLSQPALSIHIKELESELGVPLFIRTNRNLRLTPAGRVLYGRTAPFFQGEEELLRAVRQAALSDHARLTVGSVGASIISELPDLAASFREQYSDVAIEVRRMNWDPLNEALFCGAVDVGFQFFSGLGGQDRSELFQYYPIRRGKLMAVVFKSDPLVGRGTVSLADLRGRPFAVLDPRQSHIPYEHFFALCKNAGFEPKIAAQYTFIEPLLTAVNLGSAITITSDLAPVQGLKNLRCLELEDAAMLELDMVWQRDSKNPATQLFVRYVMDSGW